MLDQRAIKDGKKLKTSRFSQYFLNPLSRILHHNTAGYANNVLAMRQLKQFQAESQSTLGTLKPDPRVDFLTKEKYLLMDPKYDKTLLHVLCARAKELFGDPTAFVSTGRYQIKPSQAILRPIQQIPEIQQLLTPEIAHIVSAYYQSHFKVEMVRMWRNQAVPSQAAGEDHYSNLWHNDYDLTTRLRYFVYLTDHVDMETGALRFHPGTKSREILFSGYIKRDLMTHLARRKLEDPNKIIYFKGNIGSACFLNPQLCFHRAGIPKEGAHRDVIQFTFVPHPTPLDPNWAEMIGEDPEINMKGM